MPLAQRPNGNYIQADSFYNMGGLNITDSPFVVKETQAVAGSDYDYLATGGIKKRNGHTRLNASADAQHLSLGFYLHNTAAGVKTVIRAAGTKLQAVNTTTGATTNVAEDTTGASTTAFSTTQPVVFSQFNTTLKNVSWMAGGGAGSAKLLGYTGTNFTVNGVDLATGSLAFTGHTSGGSLPDNITYYYAIVLHKASTGATGNATLDAVHTTGNSGSNINSTTIDLTSVSAGDTVKYDQFLIYRSAAAGVAGFTTGDLIATIASTSTTYLDTGAVQGTAQLVPRANSTSLDNSQLPAGTYNVLTSFKRRLVTAQGSTLYFSDLNKPESWPTTNTITVPSGGNITALSVISFSTPTTSSIDEFLVIFKENEVWVVTGTSTSDWALKLNDYCGCVAQPLVVFANGFLFWVNYRGVLCCDGSNKPIYLSRLIEYDFSVNGDIDRSQLTLGNGGFFQKQNQIIWHLSGITEGTQKLVLKLDVRLTLPGMQENAVSGRILEGVFSKDSLTYPVYACFPTLPSYDETFYAGGNEGFIWKLYDNANSDNGAAINFSYRTRPEDFGLLSTTKRFHKVILWCRESTLNNVTLNYWVSYKTDASRKATQTQPVTNQVSNAIWDQATWDAAYWDLLLTTYTPVVFNLGNATVGVEGDALSIEISQMDANAPLIVAGYSVFYTVSGLRK